MRSGFAGSVSQDRTRESRRGRNRTAPAARSGRGCRWCGWCVADAYSGMVLGQRQNDVDVAAGGVGVGTQLVGGVEELPGGLLVDAVDLGFDGGPEAVA